jgi:hypothetical protein
LQLFVLTFLVCQMFCHGANIAPFNFVVVRSYG